MPFIATKSLMLVRKTPARTTSSKLLPAASRTAERFRKTRSVSASIPPSTSLPVAGSWATCPLKKSKASTFTAWENGPTGGVSYGEVIGGLLMDRSLRDFPRLSLLAPPHPPFDITGHESLDRFHHPQNVAAEDLLDVRLGIPLPQQRVGDLRQFRHVFHTQRHRGAVEVGSEADVIDACGLHGVVDVLDDL